MIINEIKIFFLVLSFVYSLRFILEFIIKLIQEEPVPMKINKVNEIFLYLSLSYIITSLII
jgi:hypothetical protein